MKIKCMFKGCDGVINLSKEFREFQRYLDDDEVSWCTHSISCPKCRNPVGDIDLGPGYWVNINCKNDKEMMYYSINDPTEKKPIRLPKKVDKSKEKMKILNPYLKEWARYEEK